MALNWASLQPNGELLKLAQEKTFLTIHSVDFTLSPLSAPAATIKASGSVYVSNKRIAFISSQPKTANGIQSLSVPLSHFQDGRFVQPWLSANYYEANIRPVENGGLTEPHLLKLDFREGRGFEFTTGVEEVKSRFDPDSRQRESEVESLPAYEAPPGTPSTQGTSIPDPAALEAASVARETEQVECERNEVENVVPPGYVP